MKRLNKEYSLDISNCIGIKYGSVNKDYPRVVYLLCKTWLCPRYSGDYEDTIFNIMSEFRSNVKREIYGNKLLDKKFVFDYDIKTASLREDKKNFVTFEIYIKQNADKILSLKEIKPSLEHMFTDVIHKLADRINDNAFELSKSKG